MSYQLIPVLSSATLNLSTINRCSFNLALHLRNHYSSLQHTIKIFDFGHFSDTHRTFNVKTFNVKTKSFVQVSKSMQQQNLNRSSSIYPGIKIILLRFTLYVFRFFFLFFVLLFFLLYSKCMHTLFYRAKYSNFRTFQIYQLLSLGHFKHTITDNVRILPTFQRHHSQ